MEYSSREAQLLTRTIDILNEIGRECQSIPGLSYPVVKLSSELCSYLSELKFQEEKDLQLGDGPVKRALLERNRLLKAYNESFDTRFYSEAAETEYQLNNQLIVDLSPTVVDKSDVYDDNKIREHLGQYINYVSSDVIHVNNSKTNIVELTKRAITNKQEQDNTDKNLFDEFIVYENKNNKVTIKYFKSNSNSNDFFDMNFSIIETSGCKKSFSLRFIQSENIFYKNESKVYSVLENKEYPGLAEHISLSFVRSVLNVFFETIITDHVEKLDNTIVSDVLIEKKLRELFKQKFYDDVPLEEKNKYFNQSSQMYHKYGHSKNYSPSFNKSEISFSLDDDGVLVSLWYKLYYLDPGTKQYNSNNYMDIHYDRKTGLKIQKSSARLITQTTLDYILDSLLKENFEY